MVDRTRRGVDQLALDLIRAGGERTGFDLDLA